MWTCKKFEWDMYQSKNHFLTLTTRLTHLSAVHPFEDREKNVIYLALAPPHPVLCKPGTPQLRKSTTRMCERVSPPHEGVKLLMGL